MGFGLSIAVLVAAVAASIAVMLLVRRGAPEGGYFADSDRASGVFGVLATGFAIFAGFVIFLAFTSYDQSRSGAEAEALVVLQQYETAQSFPSPVRNDLSAGLVCYARSVVFQEWRRLKGGEAVPPINSWGLTFFTALQATEPRAASEQSAYDRWHDQNASRVEARRDRLYGAVGIIPRPLWFVLLLTAAILFGYLLLYADRAERVRAQAMLMGSATAVVAVTLLAINSLNNPFDAGPAALQPTAMERTLEVMDDAQAALGARIPLPCDEEGVARA